MPGHGAGETEVPAKLRDLLPRLQCLAGFGVLGRPSQKVRFGEQKAQMTWNSSATCTPFHRSKNVLDSNADSSGGALQKALSVSMCFGSMRHYVHITCMPPSRAKWMPLPADPRCLHCRGQRLSGRPTPSAHHPRRLWHAPRGKRGESQRRAEWLELVILGHLAAVTHPASSRSNTWSRLAFSPMFGVWACIYHSQKEGIFTSTCSRGVMKILVFRGAHFRPPGNIIGPEEQSPTEQIK